MRNCQPILLVEDDTIDAMTVKRAFKELKVINPLAHALNGEDALAYLRQGEGENPCVILLDLNMPKMNGVEFLKVAKDDPSLKKIPVVVLTTSNEERDIESFAGRPATSSSRWTTANSSRPSGRSTSIDSERTARRRHRAATVMRPEAACRRVLSVRNPCRSVPASDHLIIILLTRG